MQDILRGTRRSIRRARLTINPSWLLVAGAIVVAWSAGSAIVAGGTRALLALVLGGVAIAVPILWAVSRSRLRRDFAAIELPALLFLLAELVFRQRDAASLATDPLDPAGLYRVACIGAALLLGALALTSPVRRTDERITTRPFRLYCGYVLVVFIGAPLSVNFLLTAYRGVELATGIVVVAGAYRRAGREAVERILMLIYWFTAVSVVVILLEALLVPGRAFVEVDSPFPIQLQGVLPSVSANGTGSMGATLGLWSLAQLLSPPDRGSSSRGLLRVLAIMGFATLALAQYRTGYAATLFCLLVLLFLRRRAMMYWVIVLGVLTATIWGPQLVRESEPILQRGSTPEVVRSLSGRINYWEAALPVWRESPVLGRGLLTATRFEVLAKLGSVYTSTIHGTWVEALVGTGLIGLALLAASFLMIVARALRESVAPAGRVVPVILLTLLAVRSITGPTFEVASTASLQILTIALLLRDLPTAGRQQHRVSTMARSRR